MSTPRRSRALHVSGALAASTMLVVLAGCSGSPSGPTTADPNAKVTIEVWSGQSDEAETVIEGLAKEFEKDHPNVTVDLSPGASSTDDLLQKLSAGFAGNEYPDMSYAYGSWTGQLEASGRTLDISDEIKKPEVKWDEFTAAARGTAQPTGKKVIGFPAVVDNVGSVLQQDCLRQCGRCLSDRRLDLGRLPHGG